MNDVRITGFIVDIMRGLDMIWSLPFIKSTNQGIAR